MEGAANNEEERSLMQSDMNPFWSQPQCKKTVCISAQAWRRSCQIWITTVGLINDQSMFCASCHMEGKQFTWPCYKRVGTTKHLVKQQASWPCNMQALVIFDETSGTLVWTVTPMRKHHWWNPVISYQE